MELFNTIFEYLPEHCIGVCRAHCEGVLASQLPSHLRRGHGELTAATRKAIVLAAAEHSAWATSANTVALPLPESKPIAYLPVYRDGMRCSMATKDSSQCSYIVRTLRDIQEHCRKEHQWTNPRKRGWQCPEQQKGQPWVEGVWCQKFQPAGPLGRLFEVS